MKRRNSFRSAVRQKESEKCCSFIAFNGRKWGKKCIWKKGNVFVAERLKLTQQGTDLLVGKESWWKMLSSIK